MYLKTNQECSPLMMQPDLIYTRLNSGASPGIKKVIKYKLLKIYNASLQDLSRLYEYITYLHMV